MRITDIEPYDKYGEALYHRYLEYVGPNSANVSGKSDKFWEVAVFVVPDPCVRRWAVVRRWGKYGKKGQLKEELFRSKHNATKKARKLKAKKRDEGYTKEIDIVTRLGLQVGEEGAA